MVLIYFVLCIKKELLSINKNPSGALQAGEIFLS